MKRHLNLWLLVILIGTIACQPGTQSTQSGDPSDDLQTSLEEEVCSWNRPVPAFEAHATIESWQHKWEIKDLNGNIPSVPDSFFVDRTALEQLVGDDCGFRVYYTMSKPGDISSMGIAIVRINNEKQNVIPPGANSILYVDISQPTFLNVSPGADVQIPYKYISSEQAYEYSKNWQKYHGICLDDAILGNNTCEKTEPSNGISPMGQVGNSITQVVPVSQAYSAHDIFKVASRTHEAFNAYVFVNCLFPYSYSKCPAECTTCMADSPDQQEQQEETHEDPRFMELTNTFRYAFIVRAYHIKEQAEAFLPFSLPIYEKADSLDTDQSCICPPCTCCTEIGSPEKTS